MQARWRCHKAASYYNKLKRGSIVAQCRWRGRIAKREFRKLKMVSSFIQFISWEYYSIYSMDPLLNCLLAKMRGMRKTLCIHGSASNESLLKVYDSFIGLNGKWNKNPSNEGRNSHLLILS